MTEEKERKAKQQKH